MNQQIQTFLDTVCQQVKYQEVHDEIRLELRSHLDELVEKYVSSGIAETDAVNAALADMGDPVLIGQQLTRPTSPKPSGGSSSTRCCSCCWGAGPCMPSKLAWALD